MKEEKCRVIENLKINEQYYLIKLEAPYIASHSHPGNFVMAAVSSTHDPLLKRPFGIFLSRLMMCKLFSRFLIIPEFLMKIHSGMITIRGKILSRLIVRLIINI